MKKKSESKAKSNEVSINDLAIMVAKGFSSVENRMDKIENTVLETRKELKQFKLETSIKFTDIQTDIKSFKQETRNSFEVVNEKLDDMADTNRINDKRIERLEMKVV